MGEHTEPSFITKRRPGGPVRGPPFASWLHRPPAGGSGGYLTPGLPFLSGQSRNGDSESGHLTGVLSGRRDRKRVNCS